MQYKAILELHDNIQRCRICGTEFRYEPHGAIQQHFFPSHGDDALSAYRKVGGEVLVANKEAFEEDVACGGSCGASFISPNLQPMLHILVLG